MSVHCRIASALLLAVLLPGAGAQAQQQTQEQAQEQAQEPAPQVVEVAGVKNPELKPYRQMVKGLDAFEMAHHLAPAAGLRFKLVAADSKVALQDVSLRIEGASTTLALPIAADGTFVLPKIAAALEEQADLVSNKKKSQLRWRADIHTPGVPAHARRLGDLRLECEVAWAVSKDDMSFLMRNGVGLLGGPCRSQRIVLHYEAPQPLASATLVAGERRLALKISGKNARVFSPLLADDSWSDDALVEYSFAAAGADPSSGPQAAAQ